MLLDNKITVIQKKLIESGIDALFCRLSVNILAFLGYWPCNHAAAAIIPANGKPVLLVPATELDMALREAGRGEICIQSYELESTSVQRGIMDGMLSMLPCIFKGLGITRGIIGIEKSFEDGASARFFGDFKFPSFLTWELLEDNFPDARFSDATGLMGMLRLKKTSDEIEKIKKAIDIACKGFTVVRKAVKPGMTEAEITALLEGGIMSVGTGKNGAGYSRGFASVYSGARSADQWKHWACSSGRVVAESETVLMELGSVTDGYWCDLTRCACAGEPSDEAKKILDLTVEAQRLGMEAAKPGAPISGIDRACHKYFIENGFNAEFYKHSCGHATGFNYHEAPFIHEASDKILEEGMVLCIEPGLYLPGKFGIRSEDVFWISKDGARRLSNYPHDFTKWED